MKNGKTTGLRFNTLTSTQTNTQTNALKIGLSLFAVAVLAACGTQATTSAPSATTAPATQAAVEPTTPPSPTDTAQASPTSAATTEEMTATAMVTPTEAAASSTAASSGQVAVFQIDPVQSQVLFSLGEELLGKPNIVTGTATKLSGAISVTLDNPANSQVGLIQIDATSFQTDSSMRDRAIQRFILQAQDTKYQYITFEPTAIEGLPAQVSAGTAVPLKITGNLKVLDMVKPVTFDGTATMKSDTELEGNAKSTVTFADFGIQIPSVPSVANVTPEVSLEIQFVATKQ